MHVVNGSSRVRVLFRRSKPKAASRTLRTGTSVALASLAAMTGFIAVSPENADAATRRVPFTQYSSCPRLLAALQTLTLPQVGPYGLGGAYYPGKPTPRKPVTKAVPKSATTAAPASAVPAAGDESRSAASTAPTVDQQANSSATNVQEVGVDEGDSVENDGRYIYTAVGGRLRIIDTTTGKEVSNLGSTNGSEQLLLDGNKLAVVTAEYNGYAETIVTIWDVTDRSLPRRLSETHLEGSPLAIRNINNRARIVLQTGFAQRLKFAAPVGSDDKSLTAAQDQNRRIVKTSKVDAWLPRSYVVRGNGTQSEVRSAIDCREVGRPAGNVGLGFTWVATVDLNTPNPREGARGSGGVIASGQTVYASSGNLFVATTDYRVSPVPVPIQNKVASGRIASTQNIVAPRTAPTDVTTSVHMFDLTPPDGATYRASGTVAGTLLNQFSMSEWDGRLRIATTTQRLDFGSQQASGVRVLQRDGRTLKQIGIIDGLGRNERIYAVRFVGDLGYVVTFRQTDPLYVLDLRTPTAPQLLGELKIPGYSSYLHPIGPGRLLGIGQDANDAGRVSGTQLSLFDVSDPRNPKRLAAYKIGGSSQAEYDHRAFLWWPATRDVIVPFNSYDPANGAQTNGVVVASISETGITERGRVSHENPQAAPGPVTTIPGNAPVLRGPQFFTDPIQRSMIVNGNLVTISQNAVKSSDLPKLGTIWLFRGL